MIKLSLQKCAGQLHINVRTLPGCEGRASALWTCGHLPATFLCHRTPLPGSGHAACGDCIRGSIVSLTSPSSAASFPPLPGADELLLMAVPPGEDTGSNF